MKLIASAPLIDDGRIALFLRGKLVWFGLRSAPWEDVEHDIAFVSPRDFEQLERTLGGFFRSLSTEQQHDALNYLGPDDHST